MQNIHDSVRDSDSHCSPEAPELETGTWGPQPISPLHLKFTWFCHKEKQGIIFSFRMLNWTKPSRFLGRAANTSCLAIQEILAHVETHPSSAKDSNRNQCNKGQKWKWIATVMLTQPQESSLAKVNLDSVTRLDRRSYILACVELRCWTYQGNKNAVIDSSVTPQQRPFCGGFRRISWRDSSTRTMTRLHKAPAFSHRSLKQNEYANDVKAERPYHPSRGHMICWARGGQPRGAVSLEGWGEVHHDDTYTHTWLHKAVSTSSRSAQ